MESVIRSRANLPRAHRSARGSRSAAMCFNRLADWDWDRSNPRTEGRHRLVSRRSAWVAFILSLAVFTVAAAMLNPLCAALAPVAIILVCLYSLTKRFTAYTHFFLGLALSAAPMGAWAATTGNLLVWTPYVLAVAVLTWVAGFDMIYSLMDEVFDRSAGLASFPARRGAEATRVWARGLHGVSFVFLGLTGWVAGLGMIYFLCWILMVPFLIYEHRMSQDSDPLRINRAFFRMNAVISLLFLAGVGLDLWI